MTILGRTQKKPVLLKGHFNFSKAPVVASFTQSVLTAPPPPPSYADQIWVWPASEDPRSADLIELDGMVYHYVLKNLERNTLYALRLAAVGGGGYGKKTPTIYFTVGELGLNS